MDFRCLEAFVWVATLRSFRRAAEKLHTTQPAISQRVAQLEDELGVRLFDRDNRVVAITARGRVLFDYAEQALRLRSDMRIAVAGRDALHGVLRLGVAETIANTWLPLLIERVHTQYPRLAIEIDVDTSPNMSDRLISRDFDLAFLLGPVCEPAIRNLPLCQFRLGFVASPDFALPPAPVPLACLAAHPLITFSRRTQPYTSLRQLFSQAGLALYRLHASESLAPIVRMAVDRVGVAFIPLVAAEKEIRAGGLKIVDVEAAAPDLAFTASWRSAPEDHAAATIADLAVAVAADASNRKRSPPLA
jgi:DNA-binding transcriptional LysR family regulator